MPEVFDADRKWLAPEVAGRYRTRRFRGRSGRRDPRLVERLLGRAGGARASVLDVPCGAGRLEPLLAARFGAYVGADVSPAMLAQAPGSARRVAASVARLPFAAGSFDAVVCCRLLHHLDAERELPRAVAELVRVARELVVASFWDAASLHALRRRSGLRRDTTGRRAVSRARMAAAFAAAGAEVVGFAASLRFVSQQTFVVARRRATRARG